MYSLPGTPTPVWGPSVRVGDVGGQLGGSVGGNLLGFVGGCLSPDGASLLGVGYGGSFHLWTAAARILSPEADAVSVSVGEHCAPEPFVSVGEHWAPEPFITGHFGAVNDLAWAPTSTHFFSVSADQTCRLFAPLCGPLRPPKSHTLSQSQSQSRGSGGDGPDRRALTWKELSRPQIHGYDLQAVAVSPACTGPQRHLLYSAGDEKVLRVYDAPGVVLDGLARLCRVEPGPDESPSPFVAFSGGGDGRVQRAYITELGLSNLPHPSPSPLSPLL